MIGRDARKPPLRQLCFARQRLRVRAQLRELSAPLLDVSAKDCQPRLDVVGGRQLSEPTLRRFARRERLVPARGQPRSGLPECRKSGGVPACLALGTGLLIARRMMPALALTQFFAGRGLGQSGRCNIGKRRFRGFVSDLDLAADDLQLGFDVGEPVLAG
jgi:hypothetical protein